MNSVNLVPKQYSSTYPPVDSDFKNQITVINDLPLRTQMLASVEGDGQTLADRQYYSFKTSEDSLQVKENGENKGSISSLNSYSIDSTKTIYGYTITPEYINLWTDPTYRDTSKGIMYGKRGLNVKPHTDEVYDLKYTDPNNQSEISIALLHGINSNGVRLLRQVETGGNVFCGLQIAFNGFYNNFTWSPKFVLRSRIISTGSLDSEVAQLQETVDDIQKSIINIQNEIDALIPDLTKLVNAETNKFYVSR